MRHKTITSALIIFLSGTAAISQTSTAIKGSVIDNSNKPLPSATISLLEPDSSLDKAAVSAASGHYLIEKLKAGTYLVRISNINPKDWYSPKIELQEGVSYTVPATAMETAERKLKDVVVTGVKKPMIEVKADRTVFNVESSINATGSNALELLQKSPGVTVDKDENISMKSKNGVRIYIDGKPSPMTGPDLVDQRALILISKEATIAGKFG